MPRKLSPLSRRRSTNSRRVAFVRWAWRGLREKANGCFLVCCPYLIRQGKDAKATIATALQMGVKVKMVTGDAIAIAQETAKKLGMAQISSMQAPWRRKHKETTPMSDSIEKADGFAQVFPEHKFTLL